MTPSKDVQHNSIDCHYAECHDYLNVMPSVVMLNVVMLSIVAAYTNTIKLLTIVIYVISLSICPWQAFPSLV
jgi:hypothetical protein